MGYSPLLYLSAKTIRNFSFNKRPVRWSSFIRRSILFSLPVEPVVVRNYSNHAQTSISTLPVLLTTTILQEAHQHCNINFNHPIRPRYRSIQFDTLWTRSSLLEPSFLRRHIAKLSGPLESTVKCLLPPEEIEKCLLARCSTHAKIIQGGQNSQVRDEPKILATLPRISRTRSPETHRDASNFWCFFLSSSTFEEMQEFSGRMMEVMGARWLLHRF